MSQNSLKIAIWAIVVIFLSGCATLEKAKRADELQLDVLTLNKKLKDCNQSKETAKKELSDLEQAKLELERRLHNELSEYKAKLEMTDRGLVVTFLSEIFFDSGKDQLRELAKPTLQNVATVLKDNVSDSLVAIEGHTDNEPITRSGWKSNWELSSARALAVVHYFIDECKIRPKRLSAVAYGEYQSVVSNDTLGGKQQNRRVEIIIFPAQVQKIKAKN